MRAVLLCLLSCLLPACANYANDREIEIFDVPAGDIWQHIENFARNGGFDPDPLETDRGHKTFTSKWSGGAGAFRRASRRRFHARIEPFETDGKSGWRVLYHVEVQGVEDTTKNMRPEDEHWEFVGQNKTQEEVFARVMRIAFRLDAAEKERENRNDRGAAR